MKNLEIAEGWTRSTKVQSWGRSNRSGSSSTLSSSLSIISRLQLDEIHLEGYYYNGDIILGFGGVAHVEIWALGLVGASLYSPRWSRGQVMPHHRSVAPLIVNHQIKPTLSNGLDCISKLVEESCQKGTGWRGQESTGVLTRSTGVP